MSLEARYVPSGRRNRINYLYSHSTSSASRAIGSSVLPAKPSIFYGRQEVVDNIIETIEARKPARVAILGAGGVGKVRSMFC